MPSYLSQLKDKINNEVHIRVAFSEEIVDQLLEKKIDIALIESPIMKEGLIYREWEEDELVIFSNQPIPKQLRKDDLYKFIDSKKISVTSSSLESRMAAYRKSVETSDFIASSTLTKPVEPDLASFESTDTLI